MRTHFRPHEPFNVKFIGEVNKQIIADEYDGEDMSLEEIEDALITVIFREGDINLFKSNGTYLHFSMDKEGNVTDVFHYGDNDPDVILYPIMDAGIPFMIRVTKDMEEENES